MLPTTSELDWQPNENDVGVSAPAPRITGRRNITSNHLIYFLHGCKWPNRNTERAKWKTKKKNKTSLSRFVWERTVRVNGIVESLDATYMTI